MKRILAVFMTTVLILTFASCSYNGAQNDNDNVNVQYNNIMNFNADVAFAYPDDIEKYDKLPLIVWGNGTGCNPKIYVDIINDFVDAGYIVVVNSDCYGEDGAAERKALDVALDLNNDRAKGSVLYGKIDEERIVACGHSLGGKKSVNLADSDSRIKAVASIAGNSEKSETEKLKVPILFFGAEDDSVVTIDEYVKPAFENCNAPCVYASLKEGGHSAVFTDSSIYSGYIIDWFDAFLNDDENAKNVFAPDGAFSTDPAWIDFEVKSGND